MLLVEVIRAFAQQQVMRPLQGFSLVGILFHAVLHPAYIPVSHSSVIPDENDRRHARRSGSFHVRRR